MNRDSLDELDDKFGSQFDLVIAAAKRAEQIKEGAPALVETDSRNPLTIALQEIAAGKVLLKPPSEELLQEPEPTVQDYLARRGSLQDKLGGPEEADIEEELEEEEIATDSDLEGKTAVEAEDLPELATKEEEDLSEEE